MDDPTASIPARGQPIKLLGLSASSRRWGNSDILVRSSLKGAEAEGAQIRFLRLTDLDLKYCTGCMSCVFKDRDCVIDDGLHRVLEEMRWADALVIGSPTYILGATGVIKTLQERLLRFATTSWEFAGKPGLAIAAAGMPGWEPFALPQISLLFLSLGMPVIDQFVGYGQGPGEVFWDPTALTRALDGGTALGRGETAYRGQPGTCPSCHFDLVSTENDGNSRCVLCDLPGSWSRSGGKVTFRPQPGAEPRWSEERRRRHFKEMLLPSGPRYRSRQDEIRAKVQVLKGGTET
jgi:multimeric flavodoxin WrbA